MAVDTPQVSVLMPVYNAEKYLRASIDSILAQNFKNFTLILINDGSTDTSEEIALSYTDPRVVYLKTKANMGVARTRNIGLALARGEYVALLDNDDIALPTRLEKQVAYLEAHPEVGVVGAYFARFVDNPALPDTTFTPPLEVTLYDLLRVCCVGSPTAMIRKSVLDEYGIQFRPEFNLADDYAMWCDVILHARIANIPEVLSLYRWHGNNQSITSGGLQDAAAMDIQRTLFSAVCTDMDFVPPLQLERVDTLTEGQLRAVENALWALEGGTWPDNDVDKERRRKFMDWYARMALKKSLHTPQFWSSLWNGPCGSVLNFSTKLHYSWKHFLA